MEKRRPHLVAYRGPGAAALHELRHELDELVAMGLLRALPGERFDLTDAGREALADAELGRIDELLDAVAADLAALRKDTGPCPG